MWSQDPINALLKRSLVLVRQVQLPLLPDSSWTGATRVSVIIGIHRGFFLFCESCPFIADLNVALPSFAPINSSHCLFFHLFNSYFLSILSTEHSFVCLLISPETLPSLETKVSSLPFSFTSNFFLEFPLSALDFEMSYSRSEEHTSELQSPA